MDAMEVEDMHVPFGEIWSIDGTEVFCPDLGSRKEAISQVTEEGCNINWREGKFDKKDETFSKAGAHTRQAMGPAVLGFDNDLDAFCKLEDPEALEGTRRCVLRES